MQVDVYEATRRCPATTRQEAAAKIEGDAIQVVTKEAAATNIPLAHQRQRDEELLAELLVRSPGTTLLPRLERERVDQDRASPMELDVVGTTVSKGEALGERALLDVESQVG